MEDTTCGGHGRSVKQPKIKGLAHFDAISLLCNLVDPIDISKSAKEKTGASAASFDEQPNERSGNDLVVSVASFSTDLGGQLNDLGFNDNVRDHVRWNHNLQAEDSYGNSQGRSKERRSVLPSSCTGVLLETAIQHQLLERPDVEREHGCNVAVLRQPIASNSGHAGSGVRYRSEYTDLGAYYYRQFFFDNEHQNFFGTDEILGPMAISLKRDFIVPDSSGISPATSRQILNSEPLSSLSSPILNNCRAMQTDDICPLYRIIVRTARLEPLRIAILEECISEGRMRASSTSHGGIQTVGSTVVPARDVLAYALPTLQLSCLRVARADQKVYDSLMRLDEQNICRQVKAGIMYCAGGQSTEEEMYNNITGSSLFNSFLECIGELVELKGFSRYRAQLDNKNDTTGTHSVYTEYNGYELMFHVSTLLPHSDGKKQQLLRKRHIGNDILTIVFQESDAQPFSPTVIRSQFQHVFIVVRHMPHLEMSMSAPMFQVAVTQASSIPHTPPALPSNPVFPLGRDLREFILAKLTNLENAAHRSAKFLTMAMRTRHEWLVDLVENYSSTHQLDPQSTSHPWGRLTHAFKGKRGKSITMQRPLPASESRLLGGVSWLVQVTCWDKGVEVRPMECTLCISSRFLCVLCEKTHQLYLSIPVDTVIGWTMSNETGRMCIYYGVGECLQFNLVNDEDGLGSDVQEIAVRLSQFSEGSLCLEIVLQRSANNHLGFILLGGGTVGEVDPYGVAWKCGVRQNSRVLEINGKPLCGKLMKDVVSQLRERSVTLLLVPPISSPGRTRRPSYIGIMGGKEVRASQSNSLHRQSSFQGPSAISSTPNLSPSNQLQTSLDFISDAMPVPAMPVVSSIESVYTSLPTSPRVSTPLSNSTAVLVPEKPPRVRSESFALSSPTHSASNHGMRKYGSDVRLGDHRVRGRPINDRPGPQPSLTTPYSISDVQSPMFKGIVAKAKASLAASVAARSVPPSRNERLDWSSDQLVMPSDSATSVGRLLSSSVGSMHHVTDGDDLSPPLSSEHALMNGAHDPLSRCDMTSDDSLDISNSSIEPISLFDLPENASADQLRQALVRTQSELLRCQHKLAALRKENSSLLRVVEKLRAEQPAPGSKGS